MHLDVFFILKFLYKFFCGIYCSKFTVCFQLYLMFNVINGNGAPFLWTVHGVIEGLGVEVGKHLICLPGLNPTNKKVRKFLDF